MADITFTIPDDKLQRVKDACEYANPIPKNEDGTPQFTQGAWAKECIRRLIKRWDYAYRQKAYDDNSDVTYDNDIAS